MFLEQKPDAAALPGGLGMSLFLWKGEKGEIMAKTEFYGGTVNFIERTGFETTTLQLRSGSGYLFFLEEQEPTPTKGIAYLNVIGVVEGDYGRIRSPLITKWFPGGDCGGFYFVIPNADWGNVVDVSFELTPKELVRGASGIRDLGISVLWEDATRFNSQDCTWGG